MRKRSDFQLVCSTDFRIGAGARADGAGLGGVVDVDESESEPVALVPFEVVEERPIEVAADIGTGSDGAVEGGEGGRDELLTERVGSVGDAVFEDIDRFPIGDEFGHGMVERFGGVFPAEVRLSDILVFSEPAGDAMVIIMVESDEVLCVPDAIEKESVPYHVGTPFEEAIPESVSGGFEPDIVFGDTDLGSRETVLESVIGETVCADERRLCPEKRNQSAFLWRPSSGEVGMGGLDIGLIECDPETHVHAERLGDGFRIALEVFRETGCQNAAFLCEPERKSPMPEGDEGLHASSTESEDDLTVVLDGRFVEFTFARLDAGPFDGEAVGIVSERGCEVEVGFVAGVVFAGGAGDIVVRVGGFGSEGVPTRIPAESLFRLTSKTVSIGFFPLAPVIVIVAFDLMRGGGGAPEEIFREFESHRC